MPKLSLGPDHVEHSSPGRLVASGGDDAQWLVQHHVPIRRRWPDRTAIDGDPVRVGVDEQAIRRGTHAVDQDRTRSDELVCGAAARHARARKEPIQPFDSSFGEGRWSSDSSPITCRNLIVVP